MKKIREAAQQILRGSRSSRFLESLGIEPKRFWLLVDLFETLSDRGETLDQLGLNGVALRTMALWYAVASAFIGILLVAARPALTFYASSFLVLSAFLLFTVLLSEVGNSLVNPVEGLVLAHQPVNGATYTAAKLLHLAYVVFFVTMGTNTIPAFLGLFLKGARWYYPVFHLAVALGSGVVAALLCCALWGWLMRFVRVRRLKAAGQLAGVLPFLGLMLWMPVRLWFARSQIALWQPLQSEFRWAWGVAAAGAAIVIVVLGIRSLSADYLIRVSAMMHSGSHRSGPPRKPRTGEFVASVFGGQPARAGFAFVCRLTRRDFQFRRQMLVFVLISLTQTVRLMAEGWRTDPFSGRFTVVHLLPHVLGFWLVAICSVLAYGSDFKSAWIFLLAPARAFGGFAHGVWAALWLQVIAVPHGVLFLVLAWSWGVPHAGLFIAYSIAVSSTYLALELRLIEGVPFTSQVDAAHNPIQGPIMFMGGLAGSVAVALQYFLVFPSPWVVAMVTALVGAAAYFLTRGSITALEAAFRYHLGILSAESGALYREINI
ncbi:MAG TPA: hypothetical protein VGK29_25915 [Paludibaculum sp.]|jgi:hypothetical protein